jgi:DNA polymerase III delta prime subunit
MNAATPHRLCVKQQNQRALAPILTRHAHLEIAAALRHAIQDRDGPHKPILLTGESGCGKSTALIVAAACAQELDAIVVHIPQALAMVDSTTSYTYSEGLRGYSQPDLTAKFLSDLLQQNQLRLQRVTVEGNQSVEQLLQSSLSPSASASAKHDALEKALRAIAQQNAFPVVLIVDEVEALFTATSYKDADFRALQSYELAVPRTLLSLLLETSAVASGPRAAVSNLALRSGLAICATTASQSSFQHATDRLLQVTRGEAPRDFGSFTEQDKLHRDHAHLCNFREVSCGAPLSLREAASLFSSALSMSRKPDGESPASFHPETCEHY